MPSPSAASNPSDPSDPSNFSTPLSPPPTSPPSLSSPSTTSPTLSSITHSLLQTTFSLKRDFRFLKLTVSSSSSSSSSISTFNHFDDSPEEIHNKLLQTSFTRLNSATKSFIRAANVLLDEEVNKSFDAYLRRSSDLKEEEEGEGGGEEGYNVLDMTVEEKEMRRELRRLLGVVEELRGVWRRRAGRYLLGYRGSGGRHGGGKDRDEGSNDREVNGEVHSGKVEDLVVVGRFMIGDGDGNGEGDEGKWGKEREDEEIKVELERLAERLGMGKREEGRIHRL